MPELPEAETIARDLDGALRGAVVRSATVHRADVVRGGSAVGLERSLRGTRIKQVGRRGKNVVLFGGRDARLVVTPRFTGTLLLDAASDRYSCLTITFTDGRTLIYRDVRRLGTLTLLRREGYAAWSNTLGPEPLDRTLTAERFSRIIRGSKRAVKSILMDQRRLAGVGNIYANEACWRAGVRPTRSGRTLTRAECTALLIGLTGVLRASIRLRGTTFRDFRDAYGLRGGFAPKLAVYGRAGLPCRRCGATLKHSHALAGRQTVWCRGCQT
ncbi:MAG: bifunctional DNA-formamidopyrimidine glycosylase/DNA-(apurinic or apyrimidinic site) lyase [Gemmatimonadaceae bacterium]